MIPTAPRPAAAATVPGARTHGEASLAPFAARLGHAVLRLPARALLALIWLYQRTLSPALPVLFGPSCGCRFYPSCSHYAAEAIDTHGALAGTWLAFRRLIKCTPLHPGGPDPVPAPRCVRVAPALPQTLTPSQS